MKLAKFLEQRLFYAWDEKTKSWIWGDEEIKDALGNVITRIVPVDEKDKKQGHECRYSLEVLKEGEKLLPGQELIAAKEGKLLVKRLSGVVEYLDNNVTGKATMFEIDGKASVISNLKQFDPALKGRLGKSSEL